MKVAVSVPDPVFEAVERLAKQRHVPRSQLYAEALQDYVSRHGPTAVTEKLDAVYSATDSKLDERLAEAQYRSLDHETW